MMRMMMNQEDLEVAVSFNPFLAALLKNKSKWLLFLYFHGNSRLLESHLYANAKDICIVRR
jgi:hypothetical protein